MKFFRLFLPAALACCLLFSISAQVRAQSYPPVWTKTTSYVAGDIVQYGGNWFRAMKALNASATSPTSAYGSWELNFVRSNTTILIGAGQPFANLEYAWLFAHNARVADAAYLHFDIVTTKGNFNENFITAFSLDHGSGADVSIIGDNLTNINLTFPNGDGFDIDSGHSFASLSNLSINGQVANHGVSATSGGSILNVSGLSISGFGRSLNAATNGSLVIGAEMQYASFVYACTADYDGSIMAPYISVYGNASSSSAGLVAAHGGVINASNSSLTNLGAGALATNGGIIDMGASQVSGCTNGCEATYGGRVLVENGYFGVNASFSTANGTDAVATTAGIIDANNASQSLPTISVGNGDGSYVYASTQ